jgi:ABC-type molybdenum transport system ATPase subunit/photorepair protein PhrA
MSHSVSCLYISLKVVCLSNIHVVGLDPVTTRSISELLHTLVKKSDPRIILALRPQDKVPDWITHVMVVGNDHNIVLQGPKRQIDDTLTVWSQLINKTDENFLRGPLERQRKAIYEKAEADLKAGILDKGLVRDLVAPKNDLKLKRPSAEAGGEPIIEMEGVRVQYGDKVVLGGWKQQVNKKTKEGLHWRVRRGQRWAILGANGSGKTTLLSMITSDHPQTYAQPIKLFGRSRLPENGVPGISIFELQSRIGHSSPEIHAFFPRQLTVRGALESAFAETVLSKPKLNVEIDNRINAMLLHWKPELDPNHASTAVPKISTDHFPQLAKSTNVKEEHYAIDHMVGYADDIKFGELTVAQQRIVLFLRALIAKPDIVILDEAFSGLSASQRDKCMWFLNEGEKPLHRHPERDETPYLLTGLSDQQVLLTISHVPEEIPDIVRHFMRLPSDPGAGVEPLDFRLGKLQSRNAFRFPETWDAAWSPASEFETHANRARRRKKEIEAEDDMYEFKWWAL